MRALGTMAACCSSAGSGSRLVPLPEPLARELAEHFAPMEVSRL